MSSSTTLWQLIKATLGALAGVQSEAQRQQDFNSKQLLPFIISGIVGTLLFVGSLLWIVYWVVK